MNTTSHCLAALLICLVGCAQEPLPEHQPEILEQQIQAQAPQDDWIFDDTIHSIDITLSEQGWGELELDPYEYTQAQVEIDGYRVDDIGLRLRGKIGSFRTLAGKPKFKIDFNRFHPGRRFFGLESLSLNNEVVDCSYLKEALGYEVIRQGGGVASRTGFALVSVNGAPYGLYVLVETQDDRFLARNWRDGDGNLYDGKYLYYGDREYTLLDFRQELAPLYVLEEGSPVENADIIAVSDAIAASWGGEFMAGTEQLVDWPRVHATFVAEQWIQQNDGYSLNTNNYRVYFDPEDGRMELVSWDLDYAFMSSSWGFEWDAPRGVLAQGCVADATCWDAQRQAAQELQDSLDTQALLSRFDEWVALTEYAASQDPRRECSADQVLAYRKYLRDWIQQRPAYFQEFWGLQ